MPRRYDYTAPCGDEEEGCHEVRGLYAADAAACALFSQQPVAGVGTEWLPGIGDDKCLARQLVQGDKRLRHKRVARRQDGIGAVTVYEPPHDARWQLGIFAGREHQIISRAERGWSVLSDDVKDELNVRIALRKARRKLPNLRRVGYFQLAGYPDAALDGHVALTHEAERPVALLKQALGLI